MRAARKLEPLATVIAPRSETSPAVAVAAVAEAESTVDAAETTSCAVAPYVKPAVVVAESAYRVLSVVS